MPAERIQEIQKAIELFSVGQGPAKTMEEASKRSYQFWDTQPVPKLGTCNPSPCCTLWSCLVVPRLSKEALVGAVRVYGQRVSPWMAPHCCVWALVSTDPPPAAGSPTCRPCCRRAARMAGGMGEDKQPPQMSALVPPLFGIPQSHSLALKRTF